MLTTCPRQKLVGKYTETYPARHYKDGRTWLLKEESLTFEVFLSAETCVRGPLNISHTRQPSPQMSVDL